MLAEVACLQSGSDGSGQGDAKTRMIVTCAAFSNLLIKLYIQ